MGFRGSLVQIQSSRPEQVRVSSEWGNPLTLWVCFKRGFRGSSRLVMGIVETFNGIGIIMRPLQNVTISVILEKDDGLFCSDWRKGAVFSQLISGGNRRPRFFGAMRRGQNSPMDTLLKRPTREPRN